MSFYRIQTADRDVADLLVAENQVSRHWNNIDSYSRIGVSVCDSRESLAAYLATSGIPFGDGEWVIVELEGTHSDDTPYDAAYGEVLILPHTVLSVREMDDEFFEMIGAAYESNF